MLSPKKILIVDDEKELVNLAAHHMKMAGYEVISAYDGEAALALTKQKEPDLIILDLMLPKIDGWEVCRRLRTEIATQHIPIIMLTARTEIEDKLKGYDAGTDDYVTKPFSQRELVVRVKRVLARAGNAPVVPKKYIVGDIEINLVDSIVRVKGKEVYLTKKETDILKVLIERAGKLVTHEQILDEVWGEDNIVEYGNIDVHIRHLRKKLEKNPENPQLIKTVKGEGYKFEP